MSGVQASKAGGAVEEDTHCKEWIAKACGELSCRNVGNQLHLEQCDVILQLQFAFF